MKILLIQLKRIGDLVLTTPAITALRKQIPDVEITLVVSNDGGGLLPAITSIDRGLALRGNATDAGKWLRVAGRHFDACVDFTHNDRSAFLSLVSAARRRITAAHVELQSKLRARSYNELVACPVRTIHTIDYHLALVEPLGVRAASREIVLDLPASALAPADRLLREANIKSEFVMLHPGSARQEKFWKPERWAELIDQISEAYQLPCVVTGAASAFEQEHIAAIKRHARTPFTDLSGKTELLVLAVFVQKARLLITVDSAPMHFAAAFHTPQVALFGPTNPLHWRPLCENALVLQGDSGVPVADFAPKQRRVAMNLISTKAVIDAMESLLSASAAARL